MLARTLRLFLVLGCFNLAQAQDEPAKDPAAESAVSEPVPSSPEPEKSTLENVKETAEKWEERTSEEVAKLAKKVDQEPMAQKAAAGILQPIYAIAKQLSFSAFHWVAFALMASGVVSFALQLVLGKLIVLTRMGFSFKEIASDAVGLAISLLGLVLTTQAAADNSTFTQSPFAVISASAVGFIVGVILYFWGQSQELQAATGRAHSAVHKS